jgi:DNA-binding transcriptional LysR family regulator
VLADVDMVFAVAPTHPLAQVAEPIPTRAMLAHRAVVAADSSRRLAARTVGLLEGQDTLTVPDLDAKVAAQAAGLGCGFLPLHLARGEIARARLVVRQVEEPLRAARMQLAWHTERPGKALAWWIDALQRSPLGEMLAGGAQMHVPRGLRSQRR